MNSKLMPRIWADLNAVFADKGLRSITYFSEEPKKRRIKITRVAKVKGTFLTVIGRPSYAERQFIASHKSDDLRGTCWLRFKKT